MKRIDSLDELVRRLDPLIVRRIAEAATGSVVSGAGGSSAPLATFDDITGNLEWDRLDFTGSQLSDIQSRNHGDLTGVTADQHHNQSHVLATTAALGPDHTVSGLIAGQVLQATGGSAAKFAALSHGKLTDVTPDQHHPRLHNITSVNDHSIVAAQYGVVGATATDTLGIIQSSNNPGSNVRILRSTSGGALTLESFTSNGDLYAANTALRVIHHTHGGVDHAHVVINPTGAWNLDEQFGLDIDDNLLVRGWIVGKHAIQLPGATMICHYDGNGPYPLNFTGNPTGHMGQVGTVAGGVIYTAGNFGKAVQIAEATTNLVTNSSMEIAGSGWTATNASGGITASNSPYGTNALAFTATAQFGRYYRDFSGLTAGGTYAASVWVRASSSSIRLQAASMPSGTGIGSANHTGNGGWQRLQIVVTLQPGETTLRLSVHDDRAGGWNTVAFDAVQVEAKSYVTPYCDGSLGDGHSFSGATHNSTSSRTAATLWYPTADVIGAAGTVMFWLNRPWAAGSGAANTVYLQTGLGTTGVNQLAISDATNGNLLLARVGADTPTLSFDTSGWAANVWHHIALTWSSTGDASLYVDGALVDSDALTALDLTAFNRLYIGSRAFGDRQCNSLIDDLVIADRVVAEDEIRAIYESNAPVFAESSTWQWRAGQNRLWSDVEGLWMFNADGSAVLGAYAGDGAGGTKTWGGRTLGESDVLIGDEGRGGYLHWDDSAASLLVSGAVEIIEPSSFAGSGYLQIGTGTKDSTLDGWNFAAGEIVGQLNGADQVILSAADGSVRAGDTVLRASGIDLEGDTAPLTTQSRYIAWWLDVDNPTGSPVGTIHNYVDAAVLHNQNTVVNAKGDATNTAAAAWLRAESYNGSNVGYWIANSSGSITTNCELTVLPNSPTLGSNWSNHSGRNLSARVFANLVEIVGAIDAGGSPSTTLATLSAAYRPTSTREMYVIRVSGGSSSARLVTVNTSGTIVATDWTPTSGDVIYFQIVYFR